MKFNKKGLVDDLFDFLFTVFLIVFLWMFVGIYFQNNEQHLTAQAQGLVLITEQGADYLSQERYNLETGTINPTAPDYVQPHDQLETIRTPLVLGDPGSVMQAMGI